MALVLSTGLLVSATEGRIRAGDAVLYATGFESAEGFDSAYELPGQGGWVADPYDDSPDAFNGAGILSNSVSPPSQEAYVGLFAPIPSRASVSVWKPVQHVPDQKPLVRFEVRMAIADSSEGRIQDYFQWSVYNSDAHRLFTVEFDNFFKDVSYWLDISPATNVITSRGFTNGVPFDFTLEMDFELNQWNAAIDGVVFLSGLPITTSGAALTLGDVDAVWVIYDPAEPGDNFMTFDDYRITAAPKGTDAAWIERLGFVGPSLALRVHGPDDCRYAVETSTNLLEWTALKTNVVTAGSFDLVHTSPALSPMRFYRARYVP